MDISNLKRDTARIEAGEWVGDIPGMGDVRLRVRGSGSRIYTTLLARLSRAIPKDERNRDGSLKQDAAIRVMGEAMQQAILLDWEGITDTGDPVAFDPKLALEWMTQPDFRPFLDAVVYAAAVVENGRAEIEEQLEKN